MAWSDAAQATPPAGADVFAQPPGGALRIELPFAARVVVRTHAASFEEVAVELSSAATARTGSTLAVGRDEAANEVSVATSGATVSAAGDEVDVVPEDLPLVRAWVPERFCSVAVVSPGGDVEVQGVREADLRVEGPARRVSVGSAKGGAFVARAGAGGVRAASLAADVCVEVADGGAVELERVVGNAVEVACAGGEVDIGTLYAPRLELHTSGGDVRVRHADMRERDGSSARDGSCTARVDTGGGSVCFDGIDGSLDVRTGGGGAVLRANAGCGELALDTGGGDADVLIDPQALPCACAVDGEGGVRVDAALLLEGGMLSETVASDGAHGGMGESDGAGGVEQVRVGAGLHTRGQGVVGSCHGVRARAVDAVGNVAD